MSADADDLLERARRAEDRNIPTIDEAKAELADALDELERRFPDGEPPRDDRLTRVEYSTLMLRISGYRWQLENGQCVEFPRGRRSRLERSEDEGSWSSFIEGHPELVESSGSASAATTETAPEREPLSFTDAELLRALRAAIRAWDRRMPKERRGRGVSSSSVADQLAGVEFVPGRGCVPKELRPTQTDVMRVGVALARLAREGRVRRTNRAWEGNRWEPSGGA